MVNVLIRRKNLIEIIESLYEKNSFTYLCHSFSDEIVWVNSNSDIDLKEELESNSFVPRELYLNFSKKHIDNLNDLDEISDDLIEISGGREDERNLELTKIRLVSKRSNVKSKFKTLSSKLKEFSNGNGVLLNQQIYDEILFFKGINNLQLWTNIDYRDIEIKLITKSNCFE